MSHCPGCENDHLPNEDGARDAMAAGYAQGVENTEAMAIKRIDQLEEEVAVLKLHLESRTLSYEAAARAVADLKAANAWARKQCQAAEDELAAAQAVSEGRSKVLFEKAEELRLMDRRAMAAEGELEYHNGLCDRLRQALCVRSDGEIIGEVLRLKRLEGK